MELGLKFQAPGSNSFYTASLFHITQENVASKEPQDNFYTSVGEVRSQGLELEAHTQLSDNLKLLGSYTYTDITLHQVAGRQPGPYAEPGARALWLRCGPTMPSTLARSAV